MAAKPRAVLEEEFLKFHDENPHVYTELVKIAEFARSKGRGRWGIAALFERLRWISEFETVGNIYKLNNNFRAFYARMLMTDHPKFASFFQIRRSAAERLFTS